MTPEQLYEGFQDDQAWLESTLSNMTASEFTAFEAYLFAKMDVAFENDDGAEFGRIKGLILVVARKGMEAAHFMDGLNDAERAARAKAAAAQYELALGLYPPLAHAAIQFAWTALMRRTAEFGHAAANVFETTAPHQVFRPG